MGYNAGTSVATAARPTDCKRFRIAAQHALLAVALDVDQRMAKNEAEQRLWIGRRGERARAQTQEDERGVQLLLGRDCGVLAHVRVEQRGLAHVVLTQQRLDLARERARVRVAMHPVEQLQRDPPFAIGDEGQESLCG